MTQYRKGQIWEDFQGDRWEVIDDKGNMIGVYPNAYHDETLTSGHVERAWGPLKLVSSPMNLEDGSASFVTEEDWRRAAISNLDGAATAVLNHHNKWETKDSGERQVYSTGMQRDVSTNKPRFDLLVPEGVPYKAQMLTRFAELMMRGAEKYDARNWEQAGTAEELARFKESAFRHLMQWITGETDEDHAAAVLFNVMAHETTLWKIQNGETK